MARADRVDIPPSGPWLLGAHICYYGYMPRFFSTNKRLRGGFKDSVDFRTALFMGQAPDQGLFLPKSIPRLSAETLSRLKGRPFRESAYAVMKAFLEDEIDHATLRQMTDDAYQFDVPLEFASPGTWLMRLDRGPTASFKDIAALLLARLMAHLREPGHRLTVLVATSGDTGSAVGEAFKGIPGVRVVILYPREEVSPNQKRQLDSIGGTVQSIEIDGKFDDCQKMVKQAFADEELAELGLTSANSINFGRILPQISYYVYAYAQLADTGEEVVFSVPSGNFGNAMGCELARRMGVPIRKLLMPTNANDAFPRFLDSGSYEKVSPSRTCLSNAMNVGHPSNLARIFELFGGTVDKDGIVHRKPDMKELRAHLWSVSIDDDETREVMKRAHTAHATLLEPHGAVGWKGLEAYREETGDETLGIVLETAHPAKFPEVVRDTLGVEPEAPETLRRLDEARGDAESLPLSYEAFKSYLMYHYEPAASAHGIHRIHA